MTDLADLPDNELEAHILSTALDAPSSAVVTGANLQRKLQEHQRNMPLSALAPEMRERVRANMQANRRLTEQDAIEAELKAYSRDYKVIAGVGESANAYQREVFAINREADQIEREIAQIEKRLADVSHYNRETGEPVLRITGDTRRDVEMELRAQKKRLELRLTVEAKPRLAKAMEQTKADIRAAKELREDLAEIDRQVAANARQQRIAAVVEAKTRMLKNTI